MKNIISILSLFSILLVGCSQQNKKSVEIPTSDSLPLLSFNESVFYDIFPQLFDSLYYNSNQLPEYLIDSAGLPYKVKDRTSYLHLDTSQVYFIINDTSEYRNELEKVFIEFYSTDSIKIDTSSQTSFIKNLSLLKVEDKFSFKFLSSFPDDSKSIWDYELGKNFRGILYFSNIIFDTGKKYGVISYAYVKGGLNGYGGEIFIQKINNNWIIIKISESWVS